MTTAFQVAIDGPSAAGKSTIAQLLAKAIGGFYVNTGNMYRALTSVCLQANIDVEDESAVKQIIDMTDICYKVNGSDLDLYINSELADMKSVRAPEVASKVSFIARHPSVRSWLVDLQRQSQSLGNIVMEGRDIGTVVFPEAKFKFFVTASPLERARRRLAQPGETVDGATLTKVAEEIAMRDKIDSERKVSPLRPADDAVIVDTSDMTIDEVINFISQKIN